MQFPMILSLPPMSGKWDDDLSDISCSDDELSVGPCFCLVGDDIEYPEYVTDDEFPVTDLFGRVVNESVPSCVTPELSEKDKGHVNRLSVSVDFLTVAVSNLLNPEDDTKDVDVDVDHKLFSEPNEEDERLPGSVYSSPRLSSPPRVHRKIFSPYSSPLDDSIFERTKTQGLSSLHLGDSFEGPKENKKLSMSWSSPQSVFAQSFVKPCSTAIISKEMDSHEDVYDVEHREREDMAVWAVRECLFAN